MNKEAIEARLAQLRANAAQLQIQYSAFQGAIQDCEYWLEQIGAESPPPEPEAQDGVSSD